LLTAFVGIQARVREPILPLGLFRRHDLTAAQLAAFAISASFWALYLYMTLYQQDVLHVSALDAGLVYLPGRLFAYVGTGAATAYVAGLHHALFLGAAVAAAGAGATVALIGVRLAQRVTTLRAADPAAEIA
jgi:hypothetical protein